MLNSVSRASIFSLVLAATVAGGGSAAYAQEKADPFKVFKFGFEAYKSGHKERALQAYRDASEQGQVGATWKLGRMYAEGDGVPQDDYEAYKYFREVVQLRVEPGSEEEAYVGDAYAALGRYAAEGIPGTDIHANPVVAQDFYQRAAAYGSSTGQFEIGKMYLQEKNGSSVRQAGRWLKLAARKGHQGARAMLGNLMFQSGRVVDGLAMMTAALAQATPTDRIWIRSMQEEAFAQTPEEQRRKAFDLSQDYMQ
jgi:TPR repeat protein